MASKDYLSDSDYLTLSNSQENHFDTIEQALKNGKWMDVSI